jgi:cellulose synthase (UDP-forming)
MDGGHPGIGSPVARLERRGTSGAPFLAFLTGRSAGGRQPAGFPGARETCRGGTGTGGNPGGKAAVEKEPKRTKEVREADSDKTAGSRPARLRAMEILPLAVIAVAMLYLLVRLTLFLGSDYGWIDRTVATLLILAEGFLLLHGVGYFMEIRHVHRQGRSAGETVASPAPLTSFPPVAIIVSSFREPLDVIEETLISFYNLTYPNKRLYFLDDTRYDLPGADQGANEAYRRAVDDLCRQIGVNLFRRRWRGAKAGMINDYLAFTEGSGGEGFEFTPYGGGMPERKERYIIVFDADQNPFPRFIEPLVARMEAAPRLAFIQTPQYYSNFEKNRIARAAGLQQVVFYEYICEGKSISDAMFCCGTNVIFRRAALIDVGGFDETSVTEDFATSLKFHLQGWHSAYHPQVMAFGLGPEDLGGYFKQQFRWARGTVGLLRQIIPLFLKNPRQLTAVKWWEYFLSGTYYFIGPVFFILALCPVLYLFAGVPSYFARPEIYFLSFLPYLALTLATFYWTLRERRYRVSDLIVGQLLIAITFPVYLKASLSAILGVRSAFVTTPKGGGQALPWRDLWPQLGLLLVIFCALVWGLNRLYYERDVTAAVAINMLWCLYHFLILSSVFHFNNPAGEQGR